MKKKSRAQKKCDGKAIKFTAVNFIALFKTFYGGTRKRRFSDVVKKNIFN